MTENPFTIYAYRGPEFFCDRNVELSALLEMVDNQRYTLLYSMRRLGKTGLVHHLHHSLNRRKNMLTVYCDVQNTRSDAEFVTKLIAAVVAAIESSPKGVTKRIGDFFSSLRPVLTFDPVSHMPSIELTVESDKDVRVSLQILMEMLGGLSKKVQIAIDEFQQIATYDETLIDATLRGYMDKIPNVHFLFCGSQRHLLMGLFSDAKKPFFGSVDHLNLHPIDKQIYHDFILAHFKKAKLGISDDAIDEILTWTRVHTFHTQYFCNRLFSGQLPNTERSDVDEMKKEILFAFEPSYLQMEHVLSKNQLKLLKAIASEETVTTVSTASFLSKYGLAPSTAQQSLKALLEREILYEEFHPDGSRIFVYDPFFSRWLQTR